MKAVVLAAGKGKRLNDTQEHLPKVLNPILGKPMLQYVLDNLSFIPPEDISIVVGYQKELVIEVIGGSYQYPIQKELLGTGHAVMAAISQLNEPSDDVLICYGDMPLISRATYQGILNEHKKSNADCTILTAIAPNSGLPYGRVIRNQGSFEGIIEYNDCTPKQKKIVEVNVGIYVFKVHVLLEMLNRLEKNKSGEYFLTNIPRLMSDTHKLNIYTIYNSNEIYGIDTLEDLEFCKQILKHWQSVAKESGPRWFGTGGWRALIGEEFTKQNVRILSQAIVDDMKAKNWNEIVIGYDRRFLSDKAACWVAEVFAGNNITVYFIGRIAPTPMVMFTVKNAGTKYGLAVTASHNPADYNGIKVFIEGGQDAPKEVTDLFESIIYQGVSVTSIDFEQGVREGKIRVIDPNNEYVDSIISSVDMKAIRGRGLRILLDPMFGVSKVALQAVLITARCEVDVIHEQHDTLFGGRLPSPTADMLTRLKGMVCEKGYDLGIGTDGDADRIGIIDNEGNFIHPNQILTMLYYYLLSFKNLKGDCVRNIATTHILDKIAASFGQTCHEVPVGFKNISSKMEETQAVIGGESSGGLTIRGHIKGKDGIFASTLIVEMISVTGKNIPELLKEIEERFGSAYMQELDFSFSYEKKAQLKELLFEHKKLPDFGINIEKVNYIDGCKLYFENGGWIIARFSGTEPLIRIFCEMPTQKEAQHISKIMCDFLGL